MLLTMLGVARGLLDPKGMPNLTLAPEEDDPQSPITNSLGPSPLGIARDANQATELQSIQGRFNPRKIGFGILPWPGTEESSEPQDTVALAIKYLMEGKDLRDKEDAK